MQHSSSLCPEGKCSSKRGPVLITHWGLSGPAILKLSAWAAREMKQANYDGTLTVNWMGAEKPGEVENRFEATERGKFKKLFEKQLPRKPAETFLAESIGKMFPSIRTNSGPGFQTGK